LAANCMCVLIGYSSRRHSRKIKGLSTGNDIDYNIVYMVGLM